MWALLRRNRLPAFIASVELPVVLAIAPALLFPTPRRLVVLSVIPVLWVSAGLSGRRFIPKTPMNAGIGLLLAMVGVSLFVTADVLFSLGKVSGVVLGVLLFWAITRWLNTPNRLKAATIAFVLTGATLSVAGLIGADWGIYTYFNYKVEAFRRVAQSLPRVISGVPGAEAGFNQNAVAGCLVLFIPLQIALLTANVGSWLLPVSKSRWPARWLVVLQVLLIALTTGGVLLMQSRGAWMGLVVATVAFLIWYRPRTRLFAVAVTLAVAVLLLVFSMQRAYDLSVSPWGPDMARARTVSGRVEVWSKAIETIRHFPLTGIGMNVFRTVVPVVHAHNHLLQAALDLGLPGLVAYLSLWLVAFSLLTIVYRRSNETIYCAIAGGLGAGLVAHFVFSLADAIPLGAKAGSLFWITLAFTVGLHRIARSVPREQD